MINWRVEGVYNDAIHVYSADGLCGLKLRVFVGLAVVFGCTDNNSTFGMTGRKAECPMCLVGVCHELKNSRRRFVVKDVTEV